ncbi:hypothetical protein B1A91_08745, partial [Neisseria meningitidis]
ESRFFGTETYRIKNGFFRFYVLDSRFRGNDGIEVSVFPINSCYFSLLDSRLRGNDDGKIVVASDKFLQF